MHFGGKIFTSFLLTKESQVVFMWKWILCPLVHIETSCQKKTYPKRVCTKRLTCRSKSGYIVRMCILTSCQNTYQRRFLTKSPACVVEHVLSTFTCIWEMSNCQINLRVNKNHTHTRHSLRTQLNTIDWSWATHRAKKFSLFTQCCSELLFNNSELLCVSFKGARKLLWLWI